MKHNYNEGEDFTEDDYSECGCDDPECPCEGVKRELE